MQKIAVTTHLITQPLIYGLDALNHPENKLSAKPILGSLANNCQSLLQNAVDAAVVSPLEYARNSSELIILGDFAVFSTQQTQNVLLFFRKNLLKFNTISVLKKNTTYQILADILLKEYHELEPNWEEITSSKLDINELLTEKECMLMEDDNAFDNAFKSDQYLDILEEWHDKTGLPFIHQLIVLKRNSDVDRIQKIIHNSLYAGIRNLPKIAKNYAQTGHHSESYYLERISDDFQYTPTDETWHSMKEFFQYLYYYGYIEDIPELHFAER